MGYYYGYGYPGPGFSIFGFILTILFWLVVIAVIVMIVRKARNHEHISWKSMMGKSALDVLKERYAKGEIDKKEFEDKKKDLME